MCTAKLYQKNCCSAVSLEIDSDIQMVPSRHQGTCSPLHVSKQLDEYYVCFLFYGNFPKHNRNGYFLYRVTRQHFFYYVCNAVIICFQVSGGQEIDRVASFEVDFSANMLCCFLE